MASPQGGCGVWLCVCVCVCVCVTYMMGRLPCAESSSLPGRSLQDIGLVKYFVVDARPARDHEAAHLPTAFHLDVEQLVVTPGMWDTGTLRVGAVVKVTV